MVLPSHSLLLLSFMLSLSMPFSPPRSFAFSLPCVAASPASVSKAGTAFADTKEATRTRVGGASLTGGNRRIPIEFCCSPDS